MLYPFKYYEELMSFLANAAPKISPKLAPLSDDPYSAIAFFSSSISFALIESAIFLPFLSILMTAASTSVSYTHLTLPTTPYV